MQTLQEQLDQLKIGQTWEGRLPNEVKGRKLEKIPAPLVEVCLNCALQLTAACPLVDCEGVIFKELGEEE